MVTTSGLDVWCVELREIARLKTHGRNAPKKLRRKYGHCIRHWQRKLRHGRRSISVGVSTATFGRAVLQKGRRPLVITYELPPRKIGVTRFDYGWAEGRA